MAKLIYGTNISLDGYIEDEDGSFDWSEPVEEEHTFINELFRPVATHIYGRRLYEVMSVWESPAPEWPQYMQEFATIWQAADKVVFSKTLESATTPRTRIERSFDPEAIRRLKSTAAADLLIGGAELAGQAIREGLVDEYHLFVSPVILGGGKPWLPAGVKLNLELLDERRFSSGLVYLGYSARH